MVTTTAVCVPRALPVRVPWYRHTRPQLVRVRTRVRTRVRDAEAARVEVSEPRDALARPRGEGYVLSESARSMHAAGRNPSKSVIRDIDESACLRVSTLQLFLFLTRLSIQYGSGQHVGPGVEVFGQSWRERTAKAASTVVP